MVKGPSVIIDFEAVKEPSPVEKALTSVLAGLNRFVPSPGKITGALVAVGAISLFGGPAEHAPAVLAFTAASGALTVPFAQRAFKAATPNIKNRLLHGVSAIALGVALSASLLGAYMSDIAAIRQAYETTNKTLTEKAVNSLMDNVQAGTSRKIVSEKMEVLTPSGVFLENGSFAPVTARPLPLKTVGVTAADVGEDNQGHIVRITQDKDQASEKTSYFRVTGHNAEGNWELTPLPANAFKGPALGQKTKVAEKEFIKGEAVQQPRKPSGSHKTIASSQPKTLTR